MEYFYTPPQLISPGSLSIEGDEFLHLTRVLRKKPGDAITVVDGIGTAYDVSIDEITKRASRCIIQAHHHRLHEPAIDVTMAVGLLKNSGNYDFLVEKCTELGVNAVVPLLTERTISQNSKIERWQKIALAAMKQCGRCVLPKILETRAFHEFIVSAPASSLRIIPHEKVISPTIIEIAKDSSVPSAVICIGPEGGFSEAEVAAAEKGGFLTVTLGRRRLRTETAAIIACSTVIGTQ